MLLICVVARLVDNSILVRAKFRLPGLVRVEVEHISGLFKVALMLMFHA